MSGIAGLWRLDGRRLRRDDLDAMAAALTHRGPDGLHVWAGDDTGLAHLALNTTPESRRERQPLWDARRELALVADARIDNREELILSLGLRAWKPEPTDAELILEAYARWGPSSPEHLAGDFAFAVRDDRRRTLFCARDRMGVKPFYYHRSNGLFAFSSEIKGILALPEVPRGLDEIWIGDFLSRVQEDRETTLYASVRRLPPAHTLALSVAGAELRSYWALDPDRLLPRRSDEEYAEGYREQLFAAVQARLRRVGPPAALLSGGLDSSSIVCVARDLLRDEGTPIRTLSLIFGETPDCDERPYIDAVLRQGGVQSRFLDADVLSLTPDPATFFRAFDVPPYAGNVGLHAGLYRAAAGHGVRVLLDGLYGDNAVSWGTERLSELMRRGRWIELARSVPQHARNVQIPQAAAFRKYFWWAFRREFLRPLVPKPLLRARRRRQAGEREETLLRQDVRRRLGLAERHRELRRVYARRVRNARDAHFVELSTGFGVHALEMLDPIAAAYGVEPRFPFTDHRLLEYCLALPSEQRFHRGWTRMVVRRALAGVLPEEVRWRGAKTSLIGWYHRALHDALPGGVGALAAAEPYIDRAVLDRAVERFSRSTDQASGRLLWQAFVLAQWLDGKSALPGDPQAEGGALPATLIATIAAPAR